MAVEQSTTFTLELSSPDTKPLTLEAREAIIPGRAGVFTVRLGHTPLLSTLSSGVLLVSSENGTDTCFAVHGGFAEIVDGTARILTPQYERGDRIDVERATQAMERAQQRLTRRSPEDDLARAEAAVRRAVARLSAEKGVAI